MEQKRGVYTITGASLSTVRNIYCSIRTVYSVTITILSYLNTDQEVRKVGLLRQVVHVTTLA